MIKCDKCGFGHKTEEELKECKSWAEMSVPRCALCNASEPWYMAAHDATSELPLKKGDLVCRACADTLPKPSQDVLVWANSRIRARYFTDSQNVRT